MSNINKSAEERQRVYDGVYAVRLLRWQENHSYENMKRLREIDTLRKQHKWAAFTQQRDGEQ